MFGDHGGDSGSCNGDSSPEKMKSSSYVRKRNKPLMEKRRRARINDALVQLKALVLESMQQDTTQYSKLEKADILEMTVSHVASLQKLQILDGPSLGVSPFSKYRVGFNECANEVIRYLGEYRDGTCSELRTRLLNHLAGCIETSNFMRRGALGQCGRGDQSNNGNNCVNSQSDGHLRDITFQKQSHDTLVSGNETFPLQRDSTKRQLRFHGNQLSGETSAETMYSRLHMVGTSQPERNQYSPLMNRNQRAEKQNNVQMALAADGSDVVSGTVIETNIENIISDAEFRQNELYAFRRRQQEAEARVGRGSLLNRHVNQLSARDTYGNGPLPHFTRTDKNNNNRHFGGQMDCSGGALVDSFNRQNNVGGTNALYMSENDKAASLDKHSRHSARSMTDTDSLVDMAPDPNQMGFNSECVWRPW